MKLTVTKSEHIDDWYIIERAEHDGREWWEEVDPDTHVLRCSSRFSDADVEGTGAQIFDIARAIEARGSASFKRCSVEIVGNEARFSSPRNSSADGVCSLDEADELAKLIRVTLGAS